MGIHSRKHQCRNKSAGRNPANLGDISFRRNTGPGPAAICQNRSHGPNAARDSAPRIQVAAKSARAKWADSAIQFVSSNAGLLGREVEHDGPCAGPIRSDWRAAQPGGGCARCTTVPNRKKTQECTANPYRRGDPDAHSDRDGFPHRNTDFHGDFISHAYCECDSHGDCDGH